MFSIIDNKYLAFAFIWWQVGQATSFSDIIDADFRSGVQCYGDDVSMFAFKNSATGAALATRWFETFAVQGLS